MYVFVSMWCGQSFKSLADMTQHMKVTQHYTNIISQEQIISWRNPVCDESFSTLKELSNHMVKNSHFKEQNSNINEDNNDKSNDRRKKSLPVRKLLEMERDIATTNDKSIRLIECDDCHEKIDEKFFLQHMKQCGPRSMTNSKNCDSINDHSMKNGLAIGIHKSDSESESDRNVTNMIPFESTMSIGKNLHFKKSLEDNNSEMDDNDERMDDDEDNSPVITTSEDNSGGNVLSALEKLIEKNFDTKSRRSHQTGILQRLGIDEEVFPPWQNMAPSPISPASMMAVAAAWNPTNGGLVGDYSRSSSSNSNHSGSHHHRSLLGANSSTMVIPQLRYRRNSSSSHSYKDKFINAAALCKTITTESNGSFSSQETEEESCDDSNSEYGTNLIKSNKRKKSHSSPKSTKSSNRGGALNFPISSMLSSPIPPARPTSASSTASSSISPSEAHSIGTLNTNPNADLLNRLTPNSHRSETDDDQEQSPLNLFKKSKLSNGNAKSNNNDETDDDDGEDNTSQNGEATAKPVHNPLKQLQKLLDKTDNNTGKRKNSSNHHHHNTHRSSPFNHSWNDSSSVRSPAGLSERSPRTTPNPIGSPASAKSAEHDVPVTAPNYLQMKCAFCATPISSRNEYRSHLAKIHLSMRDSADISAISDEELLLLLLENQCQRHQ
uniref:Protein tip top-like isoform X2 n=1 Tax=Psoroptes ovis TaxID=83912 RepID=A0A3B0QJL0_PSOOV|nr:protein tip top-like isoform X2 [Psoroptes ovis]